MLGARVLLYKSITVITTLTFVTNPTNISTYYGTSITLPSSAVGPAGTTITYKWQKADYGDITGATSKNYTISLVKNENNGIYV